MKRLFGYLLFFACFVYFMPGSSTYAQNSPETAVVLALGDSASVTVYDGEGEEDDLQDYWWKVTTPFDGALVISTESGNAINLSLGLWGYSDVTVRNIATDQTSGSDKTIQFHIAQGIYYINVSSYKQNGTYTVYNQFTPTSLDNDVESNDDVESAQELVLDGSDTGHLGFYMPELQMGDIFDFWSNNIDTVDYWKVTTTFDGTLVISIESNDEIDISLGLYDCSDGTTQNLTVDQNSGADKTIQYPVAQGTYHIELYNYKEFSKGCSYTISSQFTPASLDNDAEPNDYVEDAWKLVFDSSDTGHLGFYMPEYIYGNIPEYWKFMDTVDWWKVTAISDGLLVISIESNDEIDITLGLYDYSDGTTRNLAADQSSGADKSIQYDVLQGTYHIEIYRNSGYGSYTISNQFLSPVTTANEPPLVFRVHPAYPNPFNTSTTIMFSLPEAVFANLVIYNVMGQKVRELISEYMASGVHSVVWNGIDDREQPVSAGVYVTRLQMNDVVATGRMILVK